MPTQDEPPVVRFDDAGQRHVEQHGETVADPLPEGAELEIVATPKVTKTSARAAVNLRISGANYNDIAQVLGYASPASARKVVEETLSQAYPDESREALRRLTGARLDDLMKKIAPKTDSTMPTLDEFGRTVKVKGQVVREANPEQLSHVKVMADLISRHARIMGVEQLDVTISPTNEQYSAMMQALRDRRRDGEAKEADPFAEEYLDAEVIDDPEEGELHDV